jgi:hypothetical protein
MCLMESEPGIAAGRDGPSENSRSDRIADVNIAFVCRRFTSRTRQRQRPVGPRRDLIGDQDPRSKTNAGQKKSCMSVTDLSIIRYQSLGRATDRLLRPPKAGWIDEQLRGQRRRKTASSPSRESVDNPCTDLARRPPKPSPSRKNLVDRAVNAD